MANVLGVVHPSLLAALAARFYPSSCTIQRATESRDGFGQVTYSWANLAGHVGLACSVAEGRERPEETETTERTYTQTRRRVALNGVYASITVRDRAVIGGVNYDIERATTDSQTMTTYLDVQVVT